MNTNVKPATRRIMLLSSAGALGISLAAGLPATAQDVSLVIGTHPTATSQYLHMVQHWQAVEEITGYELTVQESSGSEENMFRLHTQRTADIAAIDAGGIEARWGSDHDIRTFANYAPIVWQLFASANSGISSISDIEGKSFNPGPTGGGSTRITTEILDALGIEYDNFEGTLNDALEAFQDRRIDGLSYRGTGTNPTGGIIEAGASQDIVFIPFTDEEIEVARELFPDLTKAYIEANVYPNQPEEIPTIGTWRAGQLGVHKDVDEEAVYNIVKAYFEVLPEIAQNHPNVARVTPENSVSEASPAIPLHPGVIRYYREVGVEIPDELIPPEARN